MQRPLKGTLRQVGIFKSLSEAELDRLEQACSWKHWERDEHILEVGDETRNVYFLISGRARVVIFSLDGKPVSFRDIEPGGTFGEFAAIDEGPRSASVEALQPSLIASLTGAEFRRVLDAHPAVMKALLLNAIALSRSLTARVVEYSTWAVNRRIWAELVRMASGGVREGNTIIIFPVATHADIAGRISTHREAVTREFNRLAKLGLIERRGQRLAILDLPRLQRMLEDAADA